MPATMSQLFRLPAAQQVEASALDPAMVGFHSRDERSRAFNLLRTQILRASGSGARMIGVTSATPQVGKTFVACNLAASLSRLPELRTVLLDLDLRRGSVAERFGIPIKQGLGDYLSGEALDLHALSWQVADEALLIYPTAPIAIPSSELLSGKRHADLLAMMQADEETVFICDLPPVFANDDAMMLTGMLDGYLLVIENGVTTAKQITDAMRLLGREKCLGSILNRYRGGLGGGAYGYGYGSGGDYSGYYG